MPRPLPPCQRARWLESRLVPGGLPDAVRAVCVRGPLDPAELRRRLDRMLAGQPALRTTFHAGEDGPRAVVHEPTAADLAVLDATAPAELAGALRAEARRSRPPGVAVRVRLWPIGPREAILAVLADPVALDHRSLALALVELLTGQRRAHEAQPPPSGGEERLWAYWRTRLAGEPEALDLAPERTAATGAVAAAVAEVDDATSDHLRRLAAGVDVPVHTLLLAALQLLLRRYTGVADVAIGLPVALGPASVGWHVNTVVLRQDLSRDVPVGALLRSVAEGLAGAVEHRALPLDALVSRLGAYRALPVSAEVDALLAPGLDTLGAELALGEDGDESPLGDLRARPLALVEDTPTSDLRLRFATTGARLRVRFAHDPSRLPPALVDCLRRDLTALLAEVAHSPGRGALRLLERSTLEARPRPDPGRLHTPDDAFVEFPASALDGSLTARFLDQVRRGPDRPAVLAGDRELTYGALARRAAAVAGGVRAACGRDSGPVGLLLDHGPAMIEGILGVLGTGRPYVPLDPSYPADRLAFMLRDSGAAAVVTSAGHRSLALDLCGRAGGPRPRLIDAAAPGDAGDGLDALDARIPARRPAYVLYTSGSTGRPKGVVQDHRNVLFQVLSHTNDHRISPRDRLSLVSSFAFDAAVTDLFGALLNGAAVAPFDVRRHGVGRLFHALLERRVTVLHATPTLYRHLLAAMDGEALPGVRLVLLGGEEVTASDVRLARRHLPRGCVFVNGYGATEVSFALRNHIAAGDPVDDGPVPMGWPLEGVEVVLLGPDGQPAVLRGEIEVRCQHVALGYWGDDAATAERFTSGPGGTRAYRTGDHGRRLPDGRIAFAGRRDRQVKVRGHRVELGEIESALAASPGVGQAVAVPGDAGIVAYAVPSGAAQRCSPAELRAGLERTLPHYLLPAAIVVLERLPLTPTGKVDVRALPTPARASSGQATPRDGLERAVADAWRAVLDRDDIGLEEGFFELGGHSLLLAAVQRRLERTLGIEVPMHRMLEHPTIGSLARFLRGEAAPADEEALRLVEARMERRRRARAAGG